MLKLFIKAYIEKMRRGMDATDQKRIAGQKPPEGIDTICDIPYRNDGKKEHLLDVYYPTGTKELLPVVIDIHGGGLFYGYKEINKYYNMCIAARGFTVFSINYSLVPKTYVVQQLSEVLSAFQWIAEHGAGYPADMTNVFLTGDSAGGFLALYSSMINKSQKLQENFGLQGTDLQIKALGLTSGMFYTQGDSGDKSMKYLRQVIYPRRYEKSTYFPYLEPGELVREGKGLPSYLVTSAEDFIQDHSKRLAAELEKQKIPFQLHDFPKGEVELGHVFSVINPFGTEGKQVIDEMTAWFRKWQ